MIGSTNPTPCPAKPDPLSSMKKHVCAVGVVRSKTGRISALAGREGRLRACTQYLKRYFLQQLSS
ncbi:hypothetical protein EpCFBP13511_22945 [Erwinia persicina]|uniref:Uncharacterized protein n=1 Tax=Erwinia persicina TaxID=55211 RepID=A0A4U3ES10_9GAMM|nr:hypothetical protein EpCFBP13511_22945 [Erwinia persicina]